MRKLASLFGIFLMHIGIWLARVGLKLIADPKFSEEVKDTLLKGLGGVSMFRFFINWKTSLSNPVLQAFKVNPRVIRKVFVEIPRLEVEKIRVGGMWSIYNKMMKKYQKELEGFYQFGMLVEEKGFVIRIETVFIQNGAESPVEIPLPSPEVLKELNLDN